MSGLVLTTAPIVLAAGLALLTVAPPAGADTPRSQAVGRFLDGELGGRSLESAVDLKDARASNPGTPRSRNPLDVTLGGSGTIPLSGKLHLPGSGNALHIGAANQVARAKSDGFAYGASGAVANSGGASIGGRTSGYPAEATINLSAAAVPKSGSLSLPGAGGAAALGGISVSVGAVSATASTPAGSGRSARTDYRIGSFSLTLGSPALGGVLAKLGGALKAPKLPSVPGLPNSCSFKSQALSTLRLDDGAVTIDPVDGAISVDLAALVRAAGADLNDLPANTDLTSYLTDYLTSSKGLAAGLQAALHGVLDPLQSNFAKCLSAIQAKFPPPVDAVVKQAIKGLTSGQVQLQDAANKIVDQLTAAGGSSPLAPLAHGLEKALDVGANVQPSGSHGSFTSALANTPDQADGPIARQTVVRALEVDLLPAAGSPVAALALANAAAGPSTPAAAPPARHRVRHRHHADSPPGAAVPTGVPAGHGVPEHSPALPLELLAGAVVLGGAGLTANRLRPGARRR